MIIDMFLSNDIYLIVFFPIPKKRNTKNSYLGIHFVFKRFPSIKMCIKKSA